LPKPYFVSLVVEQGVVCAGTVINFQMRLMGRLQTFDATVTEPVRGSVLAETYADRGMVTSFKIEPTGDGQQTSVTIITDFQVPEGIPGAIQSWLTRRLLFPIYVKELAQLVEIFQT
jgi:hypothetical protein